MAVEEGPNLIRRYKKDTSGLGVRPGELLRRELSEHAVPVLGGEVDVLDLDVDHVGHGGGV